MTATYAVYDASKPNGATAARAANSLRVGWDDAIRLWNAITTATNGGANKDALIGGDFGALDSANAAHMYDAAYTIQYILTGAATAGGLPLALAALDKGVSA